MLVVPPPVGSDDYILKIHGIYGIVYMSSHKRAPGTGPIKQER
jgi:hypothetical protein